ARAGRRQDFDCGAFTGYRAGRAGCRAEVCEGAAAVRQIDCRVPGHPVDAGRKVTRESSMAKLFASEVAVKICGEAVQLFGGYGFIKDYPAEKYYRDV